MFDFMSMTDNYDQRKLSNYEGKDIEGNKFVLDTCLVTDSIKPYETAFSHKFYNDGLWVILESYDTKEEATVGHDKYIELFTNHELPETVKDNITGGFEGVLDDRDVPINRN